MAKARPDQPAFTGFGPKALDFFRALAFHQDKGWFEDNRPLYDSDVKAPLVALVQVLSGDMERLGLPLRGDARSLFRLHRDVRFSKDKRPYKTNGGAVLTRDGSKKNPGLLYIHIDPEGCFTAAGFYRPEPPELLALRRRIARQPADFRTVVAALGKAGLDLAAMDDLTRLPRGFDTQDDDLAAAFRKRSFVVRRPISDTALRKAGLVDHIAGFAREAAPLLQFGWAALAAEPDPTTTTR